MLIFLKAFRQFFFWNFFFQYLYGCTTKKTVIFFDSTANFTYLLIIKQCSEWRLGSRADNCRAVIILCQLFYWFHAWLQKSFRNHLCLIENNYAVCYVVQFTTLWRSIWKNWFKELYVCRDYYRCIPIFCCQSLYIFFFRLCVIIFCSAVMLNNVFVTKNIGKDFCILLDNTCVWNNINYSSLTIFYSVIESERHWGNRFTASGRHRQTY